MDSLSWIPVLTCQSADGGLYSNRDDPADDVTVSSTMGNVQIDEVDGAFSAGPARVTEVAVRSMEILILERRVD
jgi:hypothetical protein